MNNVLVLGGTGFVGRAFCARWTAWHGGGGPRLTVATRRFVRGRDHAPLPLVDLVEADVHDDATLTRLVARHGAVVNLVGILHGSAPDFECVHAALPRRIAQACEAAASRRRVVHVSAIGAAEDAPSHYLRSKARGEQALRASPAIDLTLLRPSVMFGEGDHFLNLFARLQRWFPVVPLAGAHARFQPVWVDDVALAIVIALKQPHTIGKTFECVGPHVCTLEALVRAAGRWSGHRRPVLPLPEPLGRLQAALMGLLPGPPLLSRDNLDSMKVASVESGGWSTLPALGIVPKAMEEVAPQYLSPDARLIAWRARHGP